MSALAFINFFRCLLRVAALSLLTGCAVPGFTGPGLPVLICGLLLALLVNCRPLVDQDRLDEFWLRRLLLDGVSSGSGSAGPDCTATQNYAQSFDLSVVDPASAGIGFTITTQTISDRFGAAVAGGGDFNGDGIGDIVVSAANGGAGGGLVYVILGVEGSRADVDATDLIRIASSSTGDNLGKRAQVLDFAGDVNGDGFDDLMIGAYGALGGDGSAFLIFGSASPGDVFLSSYSAAEAARFDGGMSYEAGYSVAGLGDVNGDGLDDFAIGHKYGPADYGGANIVFGTMSGFASPVSTSAITGSVGRAVTGESLFSYTGTSVSPAGDVNQDGLRDMVVGSSAIDGQGGAYVIYGQSGSGTDIDLATWSATDGFKVSGAAGDTYWGLSSGGGGDFNGDGLPDFTTGTRNASSNAGKTALLFGGVGALDLGTLTPAEGFVLTGQAANDFSGYDHDLANDVNGDGFDDLFIGAYRAGNGGGGTQSGSAYLVFGRADPPTGTNLSSYSGGTTGIRIDGFSTGDRLGSSVATGDINGDGCADMIVGAPEINEAYVIYGGRAE